jgi:PKD repeat protein
MMKYKWYLTLIAISLVVLIGSTAGCVTIVREKPASTPEETIAPPTINSFIATPTSISPGQQATLSWDVAGAATITIQPEIGTVGSSGSLQLSPPASITYTLTATNEASSTTGSATITVTPAVASKPDLIITDIWLSGETIYYKIKNQSNAETRPTRSALYVHDLKEATDYVDSLMAGEEKTMSFSNWRWPYAAPSGPAIGVTAPKPFDIKVCADAENDIEESDKSNNCLTKIWGQTFTYDFVQNAHLAKWRSGAGDLKWPMVASDSKGAAYVLNNTVVMCPEQVSNGWILGRFADFYSELGETRSRELVVPKYAKFTAKVDLKQSDLSTDGVRVALGYLDATGSVVLFPKMDVYSDGALRVYEIDLSDMADKKTEFILWVEAKDSPVGDCVSWVEPKIVQE